MKHLAEEIQKAIKERHVLVQKHPTADLWIHNYSPICQYDKIWNEVTLQCRGLILDSEYNVHARPLKKFFNYGEIQSDVIPNEPFEVTKKEDGSLGILYWMQDTPFIATRGSFESEQAKMATNILHKKYSHVFDNLQVDRTYLFEIIYPQNRIVLDYNGLEDLIMIAVVDNATGMDLPLEDIGFPLVKRYDGISDIGILKSMEVENEEGFVVRFMPSNHRIKIKFSEYCRLHKIITQTSNVAIWECLRDGQPLDELLERIPDEFYRWVRKTKDDLESQYASIETSAKEAFDCIWRELTDQYGFPASTPYEYLLAMSTTMNDIRTDKSKKKDYALKVMGNPEYKKISGILFSMIDKREYAPIIWKMIRPEYSKPFKSEI